MTTPLESDPRLEAPPSSERDVRPIIEKPRTGLSGKAIAGLAIVCGLLLFGVLDARRRSATAPATNIVRAELPVGAAPPPLYVPPLPPEPVYGPPIIDPAPPPFPALAPPSRTNPLPVAPVPVPFYQPQPVPQEPSAPPRNASGPALVMDSSIGSASTTAASAGSASTDGGQEAASTNRVRAAMFANRATTVTQGTLIPVVLETAFDSTSPGFARALVQHDVRGFDGTLVLIPRGSRLIGEYGADTVAGQKRAMILWSRLIRPDGVTIAIGSPAADPVGRGGVRADVNTHFLERFGGAILQSTLDVGVNLAARASNSPVIVALPGTLNGASSTTRPAEIRPTLRVPAGRSVSVFVARDLDFTEAGKRR